jgi:inner membrane protein
MDNLTHSLTGVLLARAGFNKLTERGTLLMVLAMNAPDVDVVWSMGRAQHVYLDHHRGFTHSLFFTPLVALLPVIVTRQFHWKAWLAAIVGVLVHIAQDTTNVYGIRSLWPATDHWFRLDWVNIVDAWIWLILLAGVLWPLLSGLVSGEIGAKRTAHAGWSRVVLAVLLAYVAARGVLHGRAVDLVAGRSYGGEPLRSASAFPSGFSPLSWTGVAETATAWRLIPVDLTRELNPDQARVYAKGERNAAAAATDPFRVFLYFSQFPVWRSAPLPEPGLTEVSVCDLRFGAPGDSRFCAATTLDSSGRVIDSGVQLALPRTGGK